jgi:hypothetical protein
VNPTSPAPGDIVTVRGSGFGDSEPSYGLYLSDGGQTWGDYGSDATLNVDSWSDSTITFTMPEPSGTGNQWRLRPGSTADVCIASNCDVSSGIVQPPSGSYTNTNLTVADTDNQADYYDATEHVGIAPDAHLHCQYTFNAMDSDSTTAGDFFDADAGQNSLANPDAGTPLTPGIRYTDASSGLSYIWPNTPPCYYDLIDTGANAQTLLMPPNGGETANTDTVLGFMGLGAGGPYTGSATVTYADGTTSSVSLNTGDWCQPTPSGETLVVAANRTDSTVCHVYQWSDDLTPGKVAMSLTIPGGGDSYLRIFSIALGIQNTGTTLTFPSLLWSHPADIAYGTPLSSTQLDATAGDDQNDIAGTFSYNANPVGKIHNAGPEQTISATFTPTDTAHWVSGTTVTTAITVEKADQSIDFSPLSGHTLGDAPFTVAATATSGLGVTFGAAGACTSDGSNGATIMLTAAGTCTVTAMQNGSTNYNAAPAVQQTFTVNKHTPKLSWANPAAITYPAPLSTTQLSAQADAPGTFVYNPPAGTVLHAGQGQSLQATFTPTDTADDVSGGQVSASITVNKAPLTLTAANISLHYSAPYRTSALPATGSSPAW